MNTPAAQQQKQPVGHLLLIPVSLGDTAWQHFLPTAVQERICGIHHFVVETPKAARAQLKRIAYPHPLQQTSITPLPPQADANMLDALLTPLFDGHDVGLLSDAGCPGVADPGALLVARAHQRNITVEPLVGPSSILLALMASGLNGQNFCFHGYLPVDAMQRDAAIHALETESRRLSRTQIMIETPYRNDRLFTALCKTCRPSTRLCVACELNTAGQWIATHHIAEWRQIPTPDLAQRPALFLLLA